MPAMLRTDLKSLEEDSGSLQPLNLRQRVIQSGITPMEQLHFLVFVSCIGLDSLSGADAADIVTLFKGMAVFAEDQIVPVAILSVLWISIDPKEHTPLSAMKLRQWVSQLLSRSILLGNAASGTSMHDVSH